MIPRIEIPEPQPKLLLWMCVQEIFDVEKEMWGTDENND